MAVASLVSRVTGFLRQLALVSVLGLGVVNDSYTVANTLPNIVYELLLGGVLTSVMVPLLVRAQTEDADGGEAYTRRLLTVAGAALAARDPRRDGRRAAAHPALPRRRRRTREPAARHGLRLAAAAADLLLRPRRAARRDAQHPWRVRARSPGRRCSTTSSSSPCSPSSWPYPAGSASTRCGWATPSCWCWAWARRWASSSRRSCCCRPCAAPASATARCGAGTGGSARPAGWRCGWSATS